MKNKYNALVGEVILNSKRMIATCGIAISTGNLDCNCFKGSVGSVTNDFTPSTGQVDDEKVSKSDNSEMSNNELKLNDDVQNGGDENLEENNDKEMKKEEEDDKDKIGVDNVVNDNEDVVLADNHKDENETKKKEGVWKFESVNNDWEGCNFIDDYGEEHFVPYGEILNVKIIATSKVNEEGNSFGEFPLVKLELVKDEDSGGNKKITVKMIEEGGYAYFDSKSSCLYRPFNRSKIYS